jgi:hypothetical protein
VARARRISRLPSVEPSSTTITSIRSTPGRCSRGQHVRHPLADENPLVEDPAVLDHGHRYGKAGIGLAAGVGMMTDIPGSIVLFNQGTL